MLLSSDYLFTRSVPDPSYGYSDSPFHQENEKLLAENDAASQAASAHPTKRFVSGTICFTIFRPGSRSGKKAIQAWKSYMAELTYRQRAVLAFKSRLMAILRKVMTLQKRI